MTSDQLKRLLQLGFSFEEWAAIHQSPQFLASLARVRTEESFQNLCSLAKKLGLRERARRSMADSGEDRLTMVKSVKKQTA